ncbi:hypothetical protein COK80_25950 [Bacillus anthracis]|nr:hypothetical protein COK80_25950 [Bacillus anthracis]
MENEMNRSEGVGVNLSNDYIIEEDSTSLGSIKKMHHDIRKGTLIFAVFWFHSAKVEEPVNPPFDSTPKRIYREVEAANSIWRTPDGSRKIKFFQAYSNNLDSRLVNLTAETLDDKEIEDLISLGIEYYKSADCFVFYIEGEKFNNGAVARSFKRYRDNKEIYFIIMSNGAQARIEDGIKKGQDYTLAHELGHIMYFSNYYGNTSDPNPNGSDIGHHNDDTPEEKRNLMSPVLVPNGQIPIITEAQVIKALQSKFFLD